MSAIHADSFAGLLRRLELALEASGIGIWEHNLSTGEIIWDQRLRELYSLGPEEPVRWIELVHPQDRASAARDFEQAQISKSGYTSQFRVLMPGGQVRYLRSKAHYHEDAQGHALMIGAEWDVTVDILLQQQLEQQKVELEKNNERAEYAASHDYLTGLANRRGLQQFLRSADSQRPLGALAAALHIDLDLFKSVNDRYGHEAGDRFLCDFAASLAQLVPADGLAARIGGDEFLVVLAAATQESATLLASSAIAMAEQLARQLGAHLGSASVGVGVGSESWDTLFTNSDAALYEAKRKGRGLYRLYNPARAEQAVAQPASPSSR